MKIIRPLVGAMCLGVTFNAATLPAQNVGIGVSSPKSMLSVNGTTSSGGLAIGDSSYTSTAGTIAPTNGALIEGNVGIGLTAPQVPLHVDGSIWVAPGGVTGGAFWAGTADTDGTEIDLFGLIGTQRSAGAGLCVSKPSTYTNTWLIQFLYNNTTIGTVATDSTTNPTGVVYGTTSDLRLKENIRPTAKGLNDLMRIQVSDFNFKSKPAWTETGFIAQQLYTVMPEVVTQGGTDPSKDPWTVDYGRITPLLTKAIQEQQREIDALRQQAKNQEAAFKAENAEFKAENAKLQAQNTQLREANQKLAEISSQMEALKKAVAVIQRKDKDEVRTASLEQ
jgi:endosialidase-like protein